MKRLVFKKRAKKREPAPTRARSPRLISWKSRMPGCVAYYIDLVSDDAATSENKEVITWIHVGENPVRKKRGTNDLFLSLQCNRGLFWIIWIYNKNIDQDYDKYTKYNAEINKENLGTLRDGECDEEASDYLINLHFAQSRYFPYNF